MGWSACALRCTGLPRAFAALPPRSTPDNGSGCIAANAIVSQTPGAKSIHGRAGNVTASSLIHRLGAVRGRRRRGGHRPLLSPARRGQSVCRLFEGGGGGAGGGQGNGAGVSPRRSGVVPLPGDELPGKNFSASNNGKPTRLNSSPS